MLKKFFITLIKIYQFFSKFTPKTCRFVPTCSEYTKQAIEKYGIKIFQIPMFKLKLKNKK